MTFKRVVTKSISNKYSDDVRDAITKDVVAFIRLSTSSGKSPITGRNFAKYSQSYKDSDAFNLAGKSKTKVDLRLSGDMIADLSPQENKVGMIAFGYSKNSQELGKAEGNITGVRGKSKTASSKRDFLGISDAQLKIILKKYPLKDKKVAEGRAEIINAIEELSVKQAKKLGAEMVAEGRITIDILNEVLEDQSIEQL